MYSLDNIVIGRLKYDISGAALSIVVEPLPGTPFRLPPVPSDAGAGTPTYGEPFGQFQIFDRLDVSAAKVEFVIYGARAAEAGGAYTYTVPAGGRGQEGTAAQAWTVAAGAYVVQQATKSTLARDMHVAVQRAMCLLQHQRDAVMDWNGTGFKFAFFTIRGAGRGKHWSSDGVVTIELPANGTTVKGFGGTADQTVALGRVPIPANNALYYEAYISGPNNQIAGNFKVVGTTGDFTVPPHWILIAVHTECAAGEKCLRVATGETLYPWRAIGSGGEPVFANAWVNFGSTFAAAAFRKDAAGLVYLKGLIKDGTINTNAFVLPAGYRPAEDRVFAVLSGGAVGRVDITSAGAVVPKTPISNTFVGLDGIAPFPAEL